MTSFAAILGHLALNYCAGRAILKFSSSGRNFLEEVVASILLGIYLETLAIACMVFLGLPLITSFLFSIAMLLMLTVLSWGKNKIPIPQINLFRLKWYEWLLLIVIVEKFSFVIWQLALTPLYFDDALHVWSTRGRSLFGGVNWSLDPKSPVFLGHTGYTHYPLELSIWRAVTAIINGGWNDIVGRGDGLVFYFCVIATAWLTVWRFSKNRWLAATAAFFISALPLQTWHAASGYADIAVEAFAFASLSALLRREWLLAGMFAAGTAWSKNGSIALHIPGLLVMALLLQFQWKDFIKLKIFQAEKWKPAILYIAGLMTLIPWIAFQHISSKKLSFKILIEQLVISSPSNTIWFLLVISISTVLGITWKGLLKKNIQLISVLASLLLTLFFVYFSFKYIRLNFHIITWRPDAPSIFLEQLITGSSHSIFWVFTFLAICFVSTELFKDKEGLALLALLFTCFLVMGSAYCFTVGYKFLLIQTSLHRNLLHFYGLAVVIVTYGISLKYKLRAAPS